MPMVPLFTAFGWSLARAGTAQAARQALGVQASGPEVVETCTGSPHTYENTGDWLEQVVISAGTVTLIQLSTDGGSSFYDVGVLGGSHILRPGDRIKITYVVAPAVKVASL
jgi:hypothetical protein